MNEKIYYLGFSLFPGIGPALFEKLLQTFGSARKAWKASRKKLLIVLGEKLTAELLDFQKTIDLKNEYEACTQKGIQLITLEDKAYPHVLLGGLGNKRPFLLYVKGDAAIPSSPKILGIVGTRKITPYGRQVTEMITADLVNYGFTIVSGLALGVDARAHMATVKNNGKTIAVLGCGVDCCYPRENEKVYDSILESGGAIISTFPPGMKATVGSFPARNAVIAGLSQGILVTEGAADSGSLITASYAKKFERPVFAVPGPITSSLSQGANSLIKNGAVAVTDARDIMKHLKLEDGGWNLEKKNLASTLNLLSSSEEREIFELLQNGPLHFDEIVRRIEKDSKTIGSLLSLMELKGVIKSSGGMYSI